MKKIIAALCLVPSLIFGQIVESDQMETIVPHVTSETWVLIDVDNTLIESATHLGSAQWRSYIRKKALALGYTTAESELILDKFWIFVQHFVPVRLVDPAAPAVISQLQHSKTPVFALTAREPIEMTHTQKQLESVDVKLSNDDDRVLLSTAQPSLYHEGVIYCGDNTKSQALRAFFEYMGYMPKKIIFIDDKQAQVEEVEKAVEEMGIEYVGIRFSRADERVQAFDANIADLQFSHLPDIISDEEAQKILAKS